MIRYTIYGELAEFDCHCGNKCRIGNTVCQMEHDSPPCCSEECAEELVIRAARGWFQDDAGFSHERECADLAAIESAVR